MQQLRLEAFGLALLHEVSHQKVAPYRYLFLSCGEMILKSSQRSLRIEVGLLEVVLKLIVRHSLVCEAALRGVLYVHNYRMRIAHN